MWQWVKNKNCIYHWLKLIEKKKSDFHCSSKNNKMMLLFCLCDEFPKLCALMHYLEEIVVQNEHKNLIWVMYLTVQLFIFDALQLLKIKVKLLTSYLNEKKYEVTVTTFITDKTEIMILVTFYMLNFIRLNLQSLCWHTILFDSSSSQLIGLQTVSYIHWIDNSSSVINVTEYYVHNIFNDCLNELNIQKALSSMMTELNMTLFKERKKSEHQNAYNENVDLENWVLFQNKLWNADHDEVVDHELSLLMTEKILHHILSQLRDKTVITV